MTLQEGHKVSSSWLCGMKWYQRAGQGDGNWHQTGNLINSASRRKHCGQKHGNKKRQTVKAAASVNHGPPPHEGGATPWALRSLRRGQAEVRRRASCQLLCLTLDGDQCRCRGEREWGGTWRADLIVQESLHLLTLFLKRVTKSRQRIQAVCS